MITAGVDVGTRFAKVCLVRDREIIGAALSSVDRKMSLVIKDIFAQALKQAGIRRWRVKRTVCTGYGAGIVRIKGPALATAVCAAVGACQAMPEARSVADVGGIFASITRMEQGGRIGETAVNEKCAAGGGKFLEMVCAALGMDFDAVSAHAARSRTPYTLSSNCAVFAESEVITQVNAGADSADILAGVLDLMAARAATLFERVRGASPLVLVGGLARVEAFHAAFEKRTGVKPLSPPFNPQLAAAYGAALLAAGKTGASTP